MNMTCLVSLKLRDPLVMVVMKKFRVLFPSIPFIKLSEIKEWIKQWIRTRSLRRSLACLQLGSAAESAL